MFGSLLLIACSSPPEPAQGMGATEAATSSQTPIHAATESAVSPDIVLVMIDTLRIDALGVGGNSRDASPNIDAFARTGANFIRAYSSGTVSYTHLTLPTIYSV